MRRHSENSLIARARAAVDCGSAEVGLVTESNAVENTTSRSLARVVFILSIRCNAGDQWYIRAVKSLCPSTNLLELVYKHTLLFADFLSMVQQLAILDCNPGKMLHTVDSWSGCWLPPLTLESHLDEPTSVHLDLLRRSDGKCQK